jgi:hypothetical protein
MERKRLPSDVSLDALIEAAINESEAITSDVDVFSSDVVAFLMHYKLSSGKHPIDGKVLYKLYKAWSKIKCSNKAFSFNLTLYIPKEKRYYLINKEPAELIADLASAIKKKSPPATRKKGNWEHFKAFLNAVELSPGEEWLEGYVIAHFYDKWTYNNKRKKVLSETNLYNFLRVSFETRKTKTGLMVKTKNIFDKTSIQNLREAWIKKQKGLK